MGLFHSDQPKEKPHSGIVGSFSVDIIKWEPEDDYGASLIAHKFEYEDFPNGSYLIVGASQIAIFINNMATGNSLDDNAEYDDGENEEEYEDDDLMSELEDLMGDDNEISESEKVTLNQNLEGFASCFPDWDLHPPKM